MAALVKFAASPKVFRRTANECCDSNMAKRECRFCPHCVSSNGVQRMAAVALVQDQEELAV
jgi:hypothetical protein